MKLEKYRHPFIFYGFAILVPWALWFITAGISHSIYGEMPGWMVFGSILALLGIMTPMATAFALILPDREMRENLKTACTKFKGIHWGWWVFHFLFPPASLLLAQAISLLFGYDTEQFQLVEKISFRAGIFPGWVVLFVAPLLEEFGWHTYGIHCVRRRFNLFTTCFIFGVIWGIWHMPLSFIKGTYQEAVTETGTLHSINFLVSLIPYLIIDNWTYYKTKCNMIFQIIFHFVMNFSAEAFQTHPDVKVIWTVLLIIFCTFIVLREKKFFFDRSFEEG